MDYITTKDDYWISPNALYIEPNALDNPDYIQASCVSGAKILVFVKGIIDYDAGHNYRRWTLVASPTVFNSHTKKYIYAAIPRQSGADAPGASNKAIIVFPSEKIDIYGINESGEQIGSEQYYYIFLQGMLTDSGGNGNTPRQWQPVFDTGYLDSNAAYDAEPTQSEWYQYSSVSGMVTFLKDLTMKAGKVFFNLYAHTLEIVSGGSLSFKDGGAVSAVADDETSITSNTHIATPAYVEHASLSKIHDDTAKGNIDFKKNIDVFGNLVVASTSHLKGNTTIGTSTDLPADMQHWGKSEWGTFNKGILTGTGAQIDMQGNAELESLIIRRFLEVPELRYNRVSVHSGTDWFTKGSGLIERVEITSNNRGIITLHLEEGEYGTVAQDDLCMGIFHNLNGNATENVDDHKGILQYKGFTTVYFYIIQVGGQHNEYLHYALRPVSDEWAGTAHPQPQMTFAAYANTKKTDRQASVLRTTDYTVYLEKMTNWTFGPDNYYIIMGQLDGFSVWATNQSGNRYLKKLSGNGAMLGNVYMYGSIDQFDRLADHIDIEISPKRNADFVLAPDDNITITARMLSFEGVERADVTYYIQRYSDDSEADKEWIKTHAMTGGVIELSALDLYNGQATQFTIIGVRPIPTESGTEKYNVSRDFVLRPAAKDGEPGQRGEDGTGIKIDGSAIQYYKSDTEYNAATKSSGDYLVSGKTVTLVTTRVQPGAYIYTYNASSGSTTIADASLGDAYISEDNGHLFVATKQKASIPVGNGLYWLDAGNVRGQDAVSIVVDGQNVLLGDKSANINVYVDVYRGKSRLDPQSDFQCSTLSNNRYLFDGKVIWQFSTTGGRFVYTLRLLPAYVGTVISGDIPFTVTVDGVEYQQTINIRTVLNGTNGFDGCLIRRSEWEDGKVYRNDAARNQRDPETGQYVIDEVIVSDYNGGDGYSFICKKTHTASADNKPKASRPTTDENWMPLNEQAPVRTSFADISRAFIQYLQTSQIVIEDPISHSPYGAFGGGADNNWPLWFGGTSTDNAVTAFAKDGGANLAKGNLKYDADGDVQMVGRILSMDRNNRLVSSYNENGDGTIVYYYAALETKNAAGEPIRIKMKEDVFTYNDDGSIKGMQTRYYDTNGQLKWYINEDGQARTLESYWEFFTGGSWFPLGSTTPSRTITKIAVYYNPVDGDPMHRYHMAAYNNTNGKISQETVPTNAETYLLTTSGEYIIYGSWTVEEETSHGVTTKYAVRYNKKIIFTIGGSTQNPVYNTKIVTEREKQHYMPMPS